MPLTPNLWLVVLGDFHWRIGWQREGNDSNNNNFTCLPNTDCLAKPCKVRSYSEMLVQGFLSVMSILMADIGGYNNGTYPIAIHYHIWNMQLNLPSTQICCRIQYMSIDLFTEHSHLHILNMSLGAYWRLPAKDKYAQHIYCSTFGQNVKTGYIWWHIFNVPINLQNLYISFQI